MTKATNIPNNKEAYLDAAWEVYKSFSHISTLGKCLTIVCPQMQTEEHAVLKRLDGRCAMDYFNSFYQETTNV
jgi:hypothetical protein